MDRNEITDEYIINKLKDMENEIMLPSYLDSVEKTIQMKDRKNYKLKRKYLVFASMFFIVIFISSLPVFSKTFSPIFDSIFTDKGVLKAQDDNKAQIIENSIESNNIKVLLKGVVADGVRTVLSIRIDGNVDFQNFQLGGVSLEDSNGKKYEVSHYGQGEMIKDQKYYETTIDFVGSPSKETSFKFSISRINNIQGHWGFEFNAAPTPIKSYSASGIYSDGTTTLNVTGIKFTGTYTIIEGNLKRSDFAFNSKLSNSNGDTVTMLKAGCENEKFEFYYPPLVKTSELNLVLTSPDQREKIFSMKINVGN